MDNKVIINIDVWTECSMREIFLAFTDGCKDGKFIYDDVKFLPNTKTVFCIDSINKEDSPQFDNALVFYKKGEPVRIAFPITPLYVQMALIKRIDEVRLETVLYRAKIDVDSLFTICEGKQEEPTQKIGHAAIESVSERGLLYAFLGASSVVTQNSMRNSSVWTEMSYSPNFEMTMKVEVPSFDKEKGVDSKVDVCVKHKGMIVGKRFNRRLEKMEDYAIVLQESAGISSEEVYDILDRIQSEKLNPENEYEKGLIGLTINELTILEPNGKVVTTGIEDNVSKRIKNKK